MPGWLEPVEHEPEAGRLLFGLLVDTERNEEEILNTEVDDDYTSRTFIEQVIEHIQNVVI